MKWISVKDKLPFHTQLVLTLNTRMVCLVTKFLKGEKVAQSLRMIGIEVPEGEKEKDSFCSIENQGNVFNDVIYWMELPPPPPGVNH